MDWKEEFQHGVIWQDFQHKQLLENINLLVRSVTNGNTDGSAFRKAALLLFSIEEGI